MTKASAAGAETEEEEAAEAGRARPGRALPIQQGGRSLSQNSESQ